jgi:hypothetical protein
VRFRQSGSADNTLIRPASSGAPTLTFPRQRAWKKEGPSGDLLQDRTVCANGVRAAASRCYAGCLDAPATEQRLPETPKTGRHRGAASMSEIQTADITTYARERQASWFVKAKALIAEGESSWRKAAEIILGPVFS